MYDYTYDPETGGLLLNDKTALMSKEPRPVYAQELDFLGIDTIWQYEKQQDVPYMWAEANHYIYKGKTIFNTSGGSLYVKPTVDIVCLKDDNGKPTTQVLAPGTVLEPVNLDLMCQKNRILMDIIEQVAVKKIYEVYKRRQKSLDCFHVAFSGGKDSVVLLELVKKALPRSGFMVVFGDTKMEFPDTYALVDKVEAQCKAENIDFYRASTHFEPEESWRLFGPPSRVLRWCCSVHKAAPQTLKIREVLGKNDYVGLDFVGVRAQESATRSGYDVENYGKKQKGQYSHNSILEWSSAEVWLYIFTHNLPINDAASIIKSFKRLVELPLGTVLNFGTAEAKGNRIESLMRTKTSSIDPRVLLCSLYRYAEACGGYYQFSLDTLMDISIQSEGISPVKIFGFTRDEMEAMLRGLAAKYNAYIDVTFTHDLDKITLRDYHSTADVLELF